MARPIIYQLFVRHFSNYQLDQVYDGDREQNGCGTFEGITEKALLELKAMGFTHIWLTGVIEHATQTSYPERPADPVGIVKGKAGSPYAITDYFDVSADLAVNVSNRLEEFRALVKRIHLAGLLCLIDYVPNHVARSYQSDIFPEKTFGNGDDTEQFYSRENSFYYLEGQEELLLPDERGSYEPERNQGRVTGNNVASWTPSVNDWFETVKLNYGYDYTTREGLGTLPPPFAEDHVVPAVWRRMKEVLLYWSSFGVDGVRCDMAHMVPVPFWSWVTTQVRLEKPGFQFYAEAYVTDPMGVMPEGGMATLAQAGINGYYDQDLYHALKAVVEGKKGVQELDFLFFNQEAKRNGVRYIENHDEVRSAHPKHFGDEQQNLAAAAVSWLTGEGAVMVYNGQEVGETAEGETGFSGDNERTSIFDYVALPELQKWSNTGRFDGEILSHPQALLRESYIDLIQLSKTFPFNKGELYGLNYFNNHLANEGVFSFLRYGRSRYSSSYLVIANLQSAEPREVQVKIPAGALKVMGGANSICVVSGSSSAREIPVEDGVEVSVEIPKSYVTYKILSVEDFS